MISTKAQFVRFSAGGAVGTALHYATLITLVEMLGAPVTVGTLAGFTAGALVNYLIARRYVFDSRRSHRSAATRFAIVAVAGAVINTAIVGSLFSAGLHYLAAQVVATFVVLVGNFLANKHWTFTD